MFLSVKNHRPYACNLDYNPLMTTPRLVIRFVRFFYSHFYNRLAFTYDPVSSLVSRGEWRAWTGAAIPFAHGPRVLEVAVGTGNLQLDLRAAGFSPYGIELSPYMLEITRRKLDARGYTQALARGRVQELPFPDASFDCLVMTFPPAFVADPRAMAEMRRVLATGGTLLWVDAPYLYPRDTWSRFLNWLYHWTNSGPELPSDNRSRGNSAKPGEAPDGILQAWLPRIGWSWRVERVERRWSHIHVLIGTRED